MELVEGASLQDHFNSMIEKKEKFDEPRIWRIFIQICMGLRYIHKEKVRSHCDSRSSVVILALVENCTSRSDAVKHYAVLERPSQNQYV